MDIAFARLLLYNVSYITREESSMNTKLLEMQLAIQTLQSILHTVERPQFQCLSSFDFGLRSLIQPDFDFCELGEALMSATPCGALTVTGDDLGFVYALFHPMGNPDILSIVGPVVLESEQNEAVFLETLPAGLDRQSLRAYYYNMPRFPSRQALLTGLQCLAGSTCPGDALTLLELPPLPCLAVGHLIPDSIGDLRSGLEAALIAHRYDLESRLFIAIAGRDHNQAQQLGQRLENFLPKAGHPRELHSLKSELNALNFMMRKAAENNQIQLVHLEWLYRNLCHQIDQLRSGEEGKRLLHQMVRIYSNPAEQADFKKFAPLVTRAITYINEHLQEALSLRDLAKTLHSSPSYLSERFRKETGKTLTDYVNEQRIAKGEMLLMNTEDSISSIAAQLGFLDVNYFTRKFKQVHGIPPTQYRIQHKNKQ